MLVPGVHAALRTAAEYLKWLMFVTPFALKLHVPLTASVASDVVQELDA